MTAGRLLLVGFAMIAAVAWRPPRPQAAESDTAGLLLHLPFDGDLRDAGPRSLEARLDGAGVGFAPGVRGQALFFGGDSGWVTVAGDSVRSPDGSVTLELWARRDRSAPHSAGRTLVAFDAFHLYMNSGGDDADRNTVEAIVVTGTGRGYVTLNGTDPLTGLRWTHIALVFDAGRHEAALYVNGRLSVAAVRVDSLPRGARSPLTISESRPTSAFRGWIDDVRLYDHARSVESIALDATEAAAVLPVPAEGSAAARSPADTIRYTTVYDVRDENTEHLTSTIVLGMVMVGLAALLVLDRMGRVPFRVPRLVCIVAFLLIAVGILPRSARAGAATREMQRAVRDGRYTVVEGRVEEFAPATANRRGRRVERFAVHANERVYRYSYRDNLRGLGFHTPRYNGGPIRSMLRVRIADVDGRIARLEIAPEAGFPQ
ncbi:MAG: Concanavalin A-like lectin/glucanase superfamily protein [Gemmatimonadetes bacterium]|nr:Concanavalin A-like lectin/glucanase superfamily protein [Gemmatimonadota bacterium]